MIDPNMAMIVDGYSVCLNLEKISAVILLLNLI